MNEHLCAWCSEPYDEHEGVLQSGCDGFIPLDYRAKAHAIVDAMIASGERIGVAAFEDGPWLRASLRLRGAIRSHIEEMERESVPSPKRRKTTK